MRIHFTTYKDKTNVICPSIYVADRMSKAIVWTVFHQGKQGDHDLSEVIITTILNNRKISMKLIFPLSYSNFEVQAEAYWIDKPETKSDKRILEIAVSSRIYDLLSNSLGKNREPF